MAAVALSLVSGACLAETGAMSEPAVSVPAPFRELGALKAARCIAVREEIMRGCDVSPGDTAIATTMTEPTAIR